jgi:rhodanese-related sulfurtransferase
MDQYIAFFMNHWGLSLMFVGAFFWVVSAEAGSRAGGGLLISTVELTQKMNRENAIVLDLRSTTLFSAGHILAAKNKRLEDIKDGEDLAPYKGRPVVLVDEHGANASKAMQALRKKGVDDVFALKGGLNAWKQADLPLVKGHK